MKLLATAIVLCIGCAISTRSDTAPILHLTRLSTREYIDLSKVSFVRLPVITPGDPSCEPNCQTRWGADAIVDGVQISYSEDAEVAIRKMLP